MCHYSGCLTFTRRAIGYSIDVLLKRWNEEIYPNRRPLIVRSNKNKCFSQEERAQAVRELCNQSGTAPVLYKWRKDLLDKEALQVALGRKY